MTSIEERAVPTNLTWQDCLICEGNISFYCSKCKTKQDRPLSLFHREKKSSENLVPTEKEIIYGREIVGKVLSITVALLVGSVLTVIFGKHLGIGIICAVIYMIAKPILIPKFMKTMQIWKVKCDDCGETHYIATDGIAAAVGNIVPLRSK